MIGERADISIARTNVMGSRSAHSRVSKRRHAVEAPISKTAVWTTTIRTHDLGKRAVRKALIPGSSRSTPLTV